MVTVGLALAAAIGYGVADFLAGLAARRDTVIEVTLWVYAVGLVTVMVILPLTRIGRPSPGSLAWGALSGCGLGAEALALIAGFQRAPFSIAGPLSAVVGASLAILAGLLLGEHPARMALAGLILALPATATVSASAGEPARDRVSTPTARGVSTGWVGVRFGLAAGLGTAISLVALSRSSRSAGIWPVLSVNAAALVTVGIVAAASGDLHVPSRGSRRLGAASGILGAGAAILYLLAVHAGALAVAAVVTSLFPVVTVGLAVAVAGERLGAVRLVGLILAAISVSLIAGGDS